MRPTTTFRWSTEDIGTVVTYSGDNREWLRGKNGPIVSVSVTGRVGVDLPGEAHTTYAQDWAWDFVEEANPKVDFMEPHKVTLESIDAEMERLRKRLIDLQAARQVIASL